MSNNENKEMSEEQKPTLIYLFLDDERDPFKLPDFQYHDDWTWCKTYEEAKDLIRRVSREGLVLAEMSLDMHLNQSYDHMLNTPRDGLSFLKWFLDFYQVREMTDRNVIKLAEDFSFTAHTGDYNAREKMYQLMDAFRARLAEEQAEQSTPVNG